MTSLEGTKLVDHHVLLEKKVFTKWVNSHLEKAQDSIEDLFVDLRSGMRLLTLIEMFTGQKQPQERGKMSFHNLINVRTALNYLTDVKKIKLYGITAESIVDGNPTTTLGLVWMLILNFQLSLFVPQQAQISHEATPEVSMTGIKQELLEWARKATEGYEEVDIANFSSSWNDGMAFCAIINKHRPDLLDYDECDPDRPLDNIEKAFAVAEKELDVMRLINPEDVSVGKPMEKPILMYAHSLRTKLEEMPPPPRRKVSQEDMATKQSGMDTLNKMAKGDVSHPSLNPVTPSEDLKTANNMNSIHEKWYQLSLHLLERDQQLLEAHTRKKDITQPRSFNFDAWKMHFIAWVEQYKLRIRDLFQRFDDNHDGILTREQFMKGLKASGLAMNQSDMEKIADYFDHNGSGIELSEIITVLRGPKSRTRVPTSKPMTDAEKIDHEIQIQVSKCSCPHKFKVSRIRERQYKFGDSLHMVRILRSNVMVRVGGGWETLKEFLCRHDPCRMSRQTNTDVRGILEENPQPGLAKVTFRSKQQSAMLLENEERRRLLAIDCGMPVTTQTIPSIQQKSMITTKSCSGSSGINDQFSDVSRMQNHNGPSDVSRMQNHNGPSDVSRMENHNGPSIPNTVELSPLHKPNSCSHQSKIPIRTKDVRPSGEISHNSITPPYGHGSRIPRPVTTAKKELSSQRSAIVRPTTSTNKDSKEKCFYSPDQPLFPKTSSLSSVVETSGFNS